MEINYNDLKKEIIDYVTTSKNYKVNFSSILFVPITNNLSDRQKEYILYGNSKRCGFTLKYLICNNDLLHNNKWRLTTANDFKDHNKGLEYEKKIMTIKSLFPNLFNIVVDCILGE